MRLLSFLLQLFFYIFTAAKSLPPRVELRNVVGVTANVTPFQNPSTNHTTQQLQPVSESSGRPRRWWWRKQVWKVRRWHHRWQPIAPTTTTEHPPEPPPKGLTTFKKTVTNITTVRWPDDFSDANTQNENNSEAQNAAEEELEVIERTDESYPTDPTDR